MNNLKELEKLEAKIEQLYLYLMSLEIKGLSENSESILEQIYLLTKKETALLGDIPLTTKELKEKINKYITVSPMLVNLGVHPQARLLRLRNLFESVSGDAGIEYADALKYDIHKVMIKFIDKLLCSEKYIDIEGDLIRFKYDLVYFDYNMETDFLLQNDSSMLELDSREYKDDLPSYRYINQVILIQETKEAIYDIARRTSVSSFLILEIIHVLARLALCDEAEIDLIGDDLNYFFESDDLDFKVKDLILEMLDMFRQIKDGFYFSK